jgi:Tol biopolymer transport system component
MKQRILAAIFLCALVPTSGCERRPAIKLPLGYYPSARRLTPDGISAHNPTCGGGRIAFAAYVDDNYEIHTMDLDGANLKRVTYNDANDYSPALSPDGSRIAFISFIRYGQSNDEIFIMDADGRNQIRLTENTASDGGPAFSPDGKRIAFETNRDSNSEIYVMDADGGNEMRLTHSDRHDCCATFSPDGKRITFASYTISASGVKSDIYLMDLDGGDQKQLTDNRFINANPCFSTDGRLIVFDSNRDGNSEIYIMDADGGNQTRLTNNTFIDTDPVFLPDGHRIIFVAHRSTTDQLGIYTMDLQLKRTTEAQRHGEKQIDHEFNEWANATNHSCYSLVRVIRDFSFSSSLCFPVSASPQGES